MNRQEVERVLDGEPRFTVGDWALYEGYVYLVNCIIDDEAVLSDSSGAERYVPIDQLESVVTR